MNLIYYLIYCSVVFKTTNADIELSYKMTKPHDSSKKLFFITTFLYFFDFVFMNSYFLFNDRKAFVNAGVFVEVLIFISSYWYFGSSSRVESIVTAFYSKRKDFFIRDARIGFVYTVLPFVLFPVCILLKYHFSKGT